jgi:uncharacterized repeat protein (TIGR01451 family)
MLGNTAYADASEGKIELKAIAEVEVEFKRENGEVELRRTPAEKVLPGTDVIYTITATNVSDVAVGDVVIDDPIPEQMVYQGGSATGSETEITFSVDQGGSYDVPEKLVLDQPDGTKRPATPDDYTHVRWKFTQELKPGDSRKVEFRATLE